MKIDEQEFRSFIANIEKVLETGQLQFTKPLVDVRRQTCEYKKMLETPKKLSKWKQLKLIDGDLTKD